MRGGEISPVANAEPSLGLLGWIAGYKLVKGVIALLAGIGILRIHSNDLIVIALRWVQYFDIDPKGHFVTNLLAHLLRINDRRLRLLGIGLFIYAVLYTVEGVGLFLKARWAEWLTIVATCLLVPVELYELVQKVTGLRVAVLLFNLGVVAYLLWRLGRDPSQKHAAVPAAPSPAPTAGPRQAPAHGSERTHPGDSP